MILMIIIVVSIFRAMEIIIGIVVIYFFRFAKHSGFLNLLLCSTKHYVSPSLISKVHCWLLWVKCSHPEFGPYWVEPRWLRDSMFTSHTGYYWGYDATVFSWERGFLWDEHIYRIHMYIYSYRYIYIYYLYIELRNEIDYMYGIEWHQMKQTVIETKCNEVINLHYSIQSIAKEILLLNHLLANFWMIFACPHMQSAYKVPTISAIFLHVRPSVRPYELSLLQWPESIWWHRFLDISTPFDVSPDRIHSMCTLQWHLLAEGILHTPYWPVSIK